MRSNSVQRCKTIIVCFALALGIFNTTFADPCGMVPPIYIAEGDPGIKRTGLQQTYVFYKNGIETIAIHPAFEGTVEEFGMLIPFPTPPALRKVADDTFDHIRNAIDPPEVVIDLRPTPMFGFGGGGMGGSVASRSEAAPAIELLAKETRVLKEEAVGMYDVAVLQAGSSRALERWMTENGYRYPKGMDAVCEDYVDEGWCFVAVKARVGQKSLVDPKPGQRSVNERLPKGATFDGKVQAMGFRFRVDEPVVPMRLSTYNEGDLNNVVYILSDKPVKFRGFENDLVARQVPGTELLRNLTNPLPLRIIGGEPGNIRPQQKNVLKVQRDQRAKMQAALTLFKSDLIAAASNTLSLEEEELEKQLLAVSERLGIRGKEIDELHRRAILEQKSDEHELALQELAEMTLTVLDGDFPREILANRNLTFVDFKMSRRLNDSILYDAKTQRPKFQPQQNSKLYLKDLSSIHALPSKLRLKLGALLLALGCIVSFVGLLRSKKFSKTSSVVAGLLIVAGCGSLLTQFAHAQSDNSSTQSDFRYSGNRGKDRKADGVDNESKSNARNTTADHKHSGALEEMSVASLKAAVLEGESLVARGQAIVALSERSTPEAESAITLLLARQPSTKSRELEHAWLQAARIKRAESFEELTSIMPNIRYAHNDMGRPLELKLKEILANDSDAHSEELFRLQENAPGVMQQPIMGILSGLSVYELVKVSFTAGGTHHRRMAAGLLAGKTNQKEVLKAVLKRLKYRFNAEHPPWRGGPLFLPSMAWDEEQVHALNLQLSQWWLRSRQDNNAQFQQQVVNNLNALRRFSSNFRPNINNAVETFNTYAITLEAEEYLKLAEHFELEIAPEIKSHLKSGGAFKRVFAYRGSQQLVPSDRGNFKITYNASYGPGMCWMLDSKPPGGGSDERVQVTQFSQKGILAIRLPRENVYSVDSEKQMLKLASLNGRYRQLLMKFRAPEDLATSGYFHAAGSMGEFEDYRGQGPVPTAHWVYAYPNWYAWQSMKFVGQ